MPSRRAVRKVGHACRGMPWAARTAGTSRRADHRLDEPAQSGRSSAGHAWLLGANSEEAHRFGPTSATLPSSTVGTPVVASYGQRSCGGLNDQAWNQMVYESGCLPAWKVEKVHPGLGQRCRTAVVSQDWIRL
jgi:hypothetical protein